MSQSILSGRDYLALPRAPSTWLVESLIPSGGVAMMYGDPKIGKSYAALQLALALQNGGDWLGFHIPQKCRPVYIQLDTPRSLWAERLEDLIAAGVEGIDDLPQADLGTLNTWPFDILDGEHQNLLASQLKAHAPDLVIIDTLRECHSGDENDSTIMREVIARLIASVQPAALLLVHHSKKPSLDEKGKVREKDIINDLRGGYVAGKMDAIIHFSKTSMSYVGRAIEGGSVPIERGKNGMWTALGEDISVWLDTVQQMDGSLEEKAESLANLSGRPIPMCRSVLRRSQPSS